MKTHIHLEQKTIGKLTCREWFYGGFRGITGAFLFTNGYVYDISNERIYSEVGLDEVIEDYRPIKVKFSIGIDVSDRGSAMLPPVGSDFSAKFNGCFHIYRRIDLKHLLDIGQNRIMVIIERGIEGYTEVRDVSVEVHITL